MADRDKVKLESRLTLINLMKQDECVPPYKKPKFDGKTFLDELSAGLAEFSLNRTCTLEDEFFVLGKASKAFILLVDSLYEAAELNDVINSRRLHIIRTKKIGMQMGVFESYTFPAVGVEEKHTRPNGIIPCLLFCRTQRTIENLQKLSSNKDLIHNISRTMIGLGAYDLIFSLRARTLTETSNCVSIIRDSLEQFWETTTIIGVPPEHLKDEERKFAASEPFHNFSILVKFYGMIPKNLGETIVKIAHMEEFSKMLSPLLEKRERISFRQGSMDLIIPCCSQTVSDIFDLSCEMRRRLHGITSTATIAKLRFI